MRAYNIKVKLIGTNFKDKFDRRTELYETEEYEVTQVAFVALDAKDDADAMRKISENGFDSPDIERIDDVEIKAMYSAPISDEDADPDSYEVEYGRVEII